MSLDTIDSRPSSTSGSADAALVNNADKTNVLVNLVDHELTEVQGVTSPENPAEDRDFLSFYGLRENPFADCVNPDYFYRTEPHADAIDRMLMTVRHNLSLGMVTGPSGTGKTLVSQILLQKLDRARCEPVLILVSPGLSKTGLLREMLSELNVALPMGIIRAQDLLKLLHNRVIDLYHQDRRLVVIIDPDP
jgi:type II secretory pathway predicted ATPase ExeA